MLYNYQSLITEVIDLLTGDFHTHGAYSHGNGDALKNALEARKKGLHSIAVTEHGMNILVGGLREREFEGAKEEVRRANALCPEVRTYYGVEADLISPDGTIDVRDEFLDDFEIILVGMHHWVFGNVFALASLVWRNFHSWLFRGKKMMSRVNTKALINTMRRYRIDALSHPGDGMKHYDIAEVARVAVETDTCFELNNKHRSLTDEQLRYLASTEVKFLLGSDAHDPKDVGDVESYLQTALKAGIKRENILNLDREYIPKKYRLTGNGQ